MTGRQRKSVEARLIPGGRVSLKSLKFSFPLMLIASALLLSAARIGSAFPPNPERHERTPNPHKYGAHTKSQAAPQASPVTVTVKEVPAPEAKRITAVIQQQPYKHWWERPNRPEWALFF